MQRCQRPRARKLSLALLLLDKCKEVVVAGVGKKARPVKSEVHWDREPKYRGENRNGVREVGRGELRILEKVKNEKTRMGLRAVTAAGVQKVRSSSAKS